MTAKDLYEKYQADMAELQSKCIHENVSDWLDEYWAPGHGTGSKVKVCEICGKTVDRTPGFPDLNITIT